MEANHPGDKSKFYPMVTDKGQNTVSRGETGAIQVWPTDVPRERYHTDWVADRTLDWLGEVGDDPFFCWMSFPDPHHPWDPPASEISRLDWRNVPLPALFDEDKAKTEALLDTKPKHWRGYYDGTLWTNLESPREFVPREMTPDQVREINAMNHIENELIDEAIGRVLAWLDEQGRLDNTDIVFTTDHGELQGDYGLLFKGPYHCDALMRLPLIWAPAPAAGTTAAEVNEPVGHLDLAATFCHIAGIECPDWIEGRCLPADDADAKAADREYVLTEWDSEHGPVDMHLKSIYHREGLAVYRLRTVGVVRWQRRRALRPERRPAAAAQSLGRSGAHEPARPARGDPVRRSATGPLTEAGAGRTGIA
ncbi:MAG: sulfatase-like hydrolase/transferase [Gammaproteobacteria bacterium]|nr:sulfatase-like hydrolase/transferase [Gammaproteobacteria bacterium]